MITEIGSASICFWHRWRCCREDTRSRTNNCANYVSLRCRCENWVVGEDYWWDCCRFQSLSLCCSSHARHESVLRVIVLLKKMSLAYSAARGVDKIGFGNLYKSDPFFSQLNVIGECVQSDSIALSNRATGNATCSTGTCPFLLASIRRHDSPR